DLRRAAAGGAERAARPHQQYAGGGEADLDRERGGAAGASVPGATGAERDLQREPARGGGGGVLRAALAGGPAAEPAGEPADRGARLGARDLPAASPHGVHVIDRPAR